MPRKPPELTPADYVSLIRNRFAESGDPEVAEGQMRYMRNMYAYYGLKAPQWVAILKEIFNEFGCYDGQQLVKFALLCFKEEYHEMFYSGLQMVEKQLKKQPEEFIEFLEKAIVAGGWWDTVDWISKMVGIHFLRFPALQRPVSKRWIESGNIWLQRSAIVHQLLLKERTDEQLLFEMILFRKSSHEFFVQKGSGWALRQHSKIRPAAVLRFITAHRDLPSLTRREGMKWLIKNHLD